MIASGEKKEEYREITPYWSKRISGKEYTHILFRNGYSKKARSLLVELLWVEVSTGYYAWGADRIQRYYVLRLGEIVERCDGVKT